MTSSEQCFMLAGEMQLDATQQQWSLQEEPFPFAATWPAITWMPGALPLANDNADDCLILESSGEEEDPRDTDYRMPTKSSAVVPHKVVSKSVKLVNTTKKTVSTRTRAKTGGRQDNKGRPRLTDEQKAENKRKRDEDRTMLTELREFLAENTKKQKTAQQEVETATSQLTVPPPQSGQTEYIVYLSATIANQQGMINAMNMEIFNLGLKYRSDLAEADLHHREELEELRETIQAHREHEMAIQLRINEWRAQRARLLEENEKLRQAQVQHVDQYRLPSPPPPTHNNNNNNNTPSPAPYYEQHIQRQVKPEPGHSNNTLDTPTHYTWLVVEEKNARCEDLYGFTAAQLTEIGDQMSVWNGPKRLPGKGCKPTYTDKQLLLILLYHFTHYTTLRVIHDKFGVSVTSITGMINRALTNGLVAGLFQWSMPVAPITGYLHAAYFMTVQVPKNTVVAGNMYDADNGQHGIWIHCVHCEASGKAVAYYCSNTRDVDAQWIAQFAPHREATDDAYLRRMQGKFGLINSRYRGTLQEIDHTVRGLLALTNLDLGYDNAIRERVSLSV